eukprot:scaffold359_cov313-Prasinococcus_capsulatus_cf.AAC.10
MGWLAPCRRGQASAGADSGAAVAAAAVRRVLRVWRQAGELLGDAGAATRRCRRACGGLGRGRAVDTLGHRAAQHTAGRHRLPREPGSLLPGGGRRAEQRGAQRPTLRRGCRCTPNSALRRRRRCWAPSAQVLATYCDQKAAAAAAEDEGEVWKVLKIMLGDDARRNLLLHLNYEPIEPAPTAAEAEAAASEAAAAAAADPTEAYSRGEPPALVAAAMGGADIGGGCTGMPNGGVPSADSLASDFGPQGADAESFFDNLAESPGVPPPQAEEDAAEEPSEMDEFEVRTQRGPRALSA